MLLPKASGAGALSAWPSRTRPRTREEALGGGAWNLRTATGAWKRSRAGVGVGGRANGLVSITRGHPGQRL